MSPDPFLTDQALAWVNERRADLGLEPLILLQRGARESPDHCPIARSISHGATNRCLAGYLRIYLINEEDVCHTISVPSVVQRWMYSFDNGLLPEYLS